MSLLRPLTFITSPTGTSWPPFLHPKLSFSFFFVTQSTLTKFPDNPFLSILMICSSSERPASLSSLLLLVLPLVPPSPFPDHFARTLTPTLCSSPPVHASCPVSTIYTWMIPHLDLIQDQLVEWVSPLGCPISISIHNKSKAFYSLKHLGTWELS